MPAKKIDALLKDLKKGIFSPIYFLHGDESFFIDQVSDYIESHALPEHERGFNQTIMYGKDSNMGQIVNNARRFPMMAERQVVIVKEFQDLTDLRKEATTKLLIDYVAKPLPSTILVLAHKNKTLDKRKALYKAINKHAIVLESKKMYDNKVPAWIEKHINSIGYKINPKATALLHQSIGNELNTLQKEINKIVINLTEGQQEITPALVHEYVGISKDYNVFELQNALMHKNIMKTNEIFQYFANNSKQHSPIMIIANLFSFFTKVLLAHHSKDKSERHLAQVLSVNPFFVKNYVTAMNKYPLSKVIKIIAYLRQADIRTKGVDSGSMDDGAIYKELAFNILH